VIRLKVRRLRKSILITLLAVSLISLIHVIYAGGDDKLYLTDGISVLGYICTKSWMSGKNIPQGMSAHLELLLQGVGNGLFTVIYPDSIHCGMRNPPYFLVGLVNTCVTIATIYLAKPFFCYHAVKIISPFALAYQSYSTFVASKEAVLTMLAVIYVISYIRILQWSIESSSRSKFQQRKTTSHSGKLLVLSFINIVSVLCLAYARPTYILLIIPSILCSINHLPLDKREKKLIPLIISFCSLLLLVAPFATSIIPLETVIGEKDSAQSAITSVYLSRQDAASNATSSYLNDALSVNGTISKILSTVFAYRHVLLALSSTPFNPVAFIAYLGCKLAVAVSILLVYRDMGYLFIIRVFQGFKGDNLRLQLQILYPLLARISMLSAVFIYPFPHERYMLPFALASVMLGGYSSYFVRLLRSGHV